MSAFGNLRTSAQQSVLRVLVVLIVQDVTFRFETRRQAHGRGAVEVRGQNTFGVDGQRAEGLLAHLQLVVGVEQSPEGGQQDDRQAHQADAAAKD